MKITLAQLNPVVGDVRGNLQKIVATLAAEHRTSDLIVFSELFLVEGFFLGKVPGFPTRYRPSASLDVGIIACS